MVKKVEQKAARTCEMAGCSSLATHDACSQGLVFCHDHTCPGCRPFTNPAVADETKRSVADPSWLIVNTDNFGGDYPDESVVAIAITSKKSAQIMADALNKNEGPNATRYFKVEPSGYKLQPGFEP